MRIFGIDITRAKTKAASGLSAVGNTGGSWWSRILEPFPGAWQRNLEETQPTLFCYPTLYACISRIAQDVGKLPFLLMQKDSDGIWQAVENAAYSPVLRNPNGYQTAQQFRETWLISKLTQGNTYVLKERDNRGVVVRLYVLDPNRVQPLVADNGDVYYQLQTDRLNRLPENRPTADLVIPAMDIIHDRMNTFHHWLIGIPPVSAAYWPALKNLKILRNAADFFNNGANPGGILTAPAGMSDDDAQAVKDYWNTNFSGANSGKVAVIGADMKFTTFAFKSADSQMVEQMQYSDRQICQPFGIPPYIVGVGEIPAGLKVDDVTNTYYSLALQAHIEAMENLLDEGLRIAGNLGVELDLEPLLRMDEGKKAEVATKLVSGGIDTPNEGRRRFNRKPLVGGDTVYMQQQDMPLDQVRLNTIAPKTAPPPAEPEPSPDDEELRALRVEVFMQKAIAAARTEVFQ